MAERPDSGRRILVASLLLLSVATAVGFGRVFAGTGATARVVAAAVLATAAAALLARRHLAISLVGGAALLLVVLGVLVYPHTVWFGVPSVSTVRAILGSLERLGADASREIAPAPALASLMTAALLAVWAAATAAHALAVRARSAVLALVPGAVLVAFAGVVTPDPPRPVFAVLYLVASFGVLYGASLDRLSTWGPLVEPAGRGRLRARTGRWARRLAVGATLVAITMPGILPGFGATPLMRIGPGDVGGVGINPIVDIQPTLLQQPVAELFVVETPAPAYWRLLSLDRFNGQAWTSSDPLAEESLFLRGDQLPGEEEVRGRNLVQTFEIRSLSVPWLPAAYRPVEAEIEGGAARWDADAAVLTTGDRTAAGDTYTVRSKMPRVQPRALDRAYEYGAPSWLGEYLELPRLPAELRSILERITRGQQTPYRQAVAIQEYLRSFGYDVAAPAGHGTSDILFFLTESQRGYCEQFAGTMAVLLRMLGIPARVAVGFAPGARIDDRRWLVTTQDTHAWVEAYFPGHGWVPFEPTPTRTIPSAQPSAIPLLAGMHSLTGLPERVRPQDAPTEFRRTRIRGDGPPGAIAAPNAQPVEPERRWPLAAILAAAAAVAVAALGLGRTGARRLALASARSPEERIMTAYRVFEASAADIGAGRRRGETLTEYAHRLARDLLRRRDGIARLTTLSAAAAYSTRPPARSDANEAVALARRLIRDLRRRVGIGRAVIGAFRPAPPL